MYNVVYSVFGAVFVAYLVCVQVEKILLLVFGLVQCFFRISNMRTPVLFIFLCTVVYVKSENYTLSH